MKRKIVSILLFSVISFVSPFLENKKVDLCKDLDQEEIAVGSSLYFDNLDILSILFPNVKDKYEILIEEMDKKLDNICLIEDKKEWFLAYKNIIDEYSDIFDSPETIYDCFTNEELELLFRVVQAEIGDEYSFEQKVNVANVIFNRVRSDRFADTMFGVLTSDQFSTIRTGVYKEVKVSEETILACEYAFQVEDTTNGCLFFDSNNTLKYEFSYHDGAHYFYKLKEE